MISRLIPCLALSAVAVSALSAAAFEPQIDAAADPVVKRMAAAGCPVAKAFINFDANKDGILSPTEMEVSFKAGNPDIRKMVRSKDGSMTLAEYKIVAAKFSGK